MPLTHRPVTPQGLGVAAQSLLGDLFGDFTIVFEAAYFVDANDCVRYVDVRQEVNYRICGEFARRRIAFVYPIRTVYLTRAQ